MNQLANDLDVCAAVVYMIVCRCSFNRHYGFQEMEGLFWFLDAGRIVEKGIHTVLHTEILVQEVDIRSLVGDVGETAWLSGRETKRKRSKI